MIVRRVPPKATRASGFKRLGRYVIAAIVPGSGPTPESGADALGSYIADQRRHADRVEWTRVTNCQAATVRGAISEIDATQALNTRSKSDPNYHLVIAFPPGETPTREQIEDIEDTLVRGLGLGDHQRISALHNDKAHLHLHVAINLIHPETFKAAKIFRDHTTLAQLAAGLEIKHGLERTNHEIPDARTERTPDAAKTMETHTAQEPFVGWVRRVAGPALITAAQDGQNWKAVHEVAAQYGLELRRRGAGLVLGKIGEPALMMKASDVDRSLSFKSLSGRFGAFEAADAATRQIKPDTSYVRAVPDEKRPDQSLWSRYVEQRDRALMDRGLAIADINADDRRYRDAVSAHYAAKFAEIKRLKLTMGIDPRIRYDALKREQATVLRRHRESIAARRTEIRASHVVESWPDWLRRQAEAGDVAAANAMRAMATKQQRFSDTLVRNPETARSTVTALGLRPKVSRNGDATYRLPDGGAVVDKKDGLTMPVPSRGAAILVLEMARDRAPGQPIAVDGDPTQKRALIDAAVQGRFDVTFADASMEAERDRRLRELDEEQGYTAPATRRQTLAMFIANRNAWPEPGDTTLYRPLSETDAGDATFIATLRLRGVDVAIWRLGDEILVQDISGQPNAIAYTLLTGDEADMTSIRSPKHPGPDIPAEPPAERSRGNDMENDL